ncbi:MAG: hypothetical protein KatS3mg009_2236 [Acidimicrobiia bacterium]|nr:MAG: hypothetical protein KatS3mg009_2236 [Acidimicrobiia bacterium]
MSVLVPLALLAWITTSGGDDDRGPAGAGTVGGTAAPLEQAGAGVEVGEPLPDFVLEDLDGDPVRLSDLRGRPVVLTFFASWCFPCQEELPVLEEAWRERRDEFTAVAVSYDDLARDSRQFVEDLGVTFPVLLDVDDTVRDRYALRGIPQTFFVDAQGVLRDRVFGITTREALDEPLDALLSG